MAIGKQCTTHCHETGWTVFCGRETHPDNFDCAAKCASVDPCSTFPHSSQVMSPGAGSGAGGAGVVPVRPSRKPTLTGQAVSWRKQSGSTDEGTILGLTTTQLLIAGAVGVGAYLLMKKKK